MSLVRKTIELSTVFIQVEGTRENHYWLVGDRVSFYEDDVHLLGEVVSLNQFTADKQLLEVKLKKIVEMNHIGNSFQ